MALVQSPPSPIRLAASKETAASPSDATRSVRTIRHFSIAGSAS
jgi:hypothetical protein